MFDGKGFGSVIKPDFKQAALTGKLYPGECVGKPYLKRVLDIFEEAYRIEVNNPDDSMQFIMDYGNTIFKDEPQIVKEVLNYEKQFNNIEERKAVRALEKGSICNCNICSLINKQEEHRPPLNKNCEDIYMNIIIEGVLGVMK